MLGIYLALNVDWVVVSLPLAFSYRVVAPQQTPWRVALAAGFTAGAFVGGSSRASCCSCRCRSTSAHRSAD